MSHITDKERADAAAVFAAATTAEGWHRVLGEPRIWINHGSYQWLVDLALTTAGTWTAAIVGREGYGGSEFLSIQVTDPAVNAAIVKAASDSLGIPYSS